MLDVFLSCQLNCLFQRLHYEHVDIPNSLTTVGRVKVQVYSSTQVEIFNGHTPIFIL